MARSKTGRSDQITRLVERANIVDVALALGLQVDRRQTEPRRAICPFHDDKDPSLRLYKRGRTAADHSHYHCYVCGAHGDAIKLIQLRENLSFPQALIRLAGLVGEKVDSNNPSLTNRRTGAAELVDTIRRSSPRAQRFTNYAAARGFDPVWLHNAGVAALSLNSLVERARHDRVLEETLVSAGIVRRSENSDTPSLWSDGLRGFFGGERLVFQINDQRGSVIGFAARALGDGTPKYLYSFGFPRRQTLYRADEVARRLTLGRQTQAGGRVDIYIVEGLFDALRLESLGFYAVAILGARITVEQLDVLRSFVVLAANQGRELHFHLFFDRDDAGQHGSHDAALAILGMLGEDAPFKFDVIWPNQSAGQKLDPDAALRGLGITAAIAFLEQAATSPLTFLAAHALSVDPHTLNWEGVPRLKLASVARGIARALPGVPWPRISTPLEQREDRGLAQFTELIGLYAQPNASTPTRTSMLEGLRTSSDASSDLLTALTLARSSSYRREYPFDDASWDRLATAASTAFHLHKLRLEQGDGPTAPLLARELPKGGGRYRLKRGPVAEDALIQQYVLLELLRERLDCPGFEANVPAIRYAPDRLDGKTIYCTGQGRDAEAVSFAYQIDMAVVNGRTPPRREGPFRPYFDCWRSFIDFIGAKIEAFHHDELQILRLDIAGFYDNIRRDAVENALVRPLAAAIATLSASDGGVGAFAPLLLPNELNGAEARAEATARFLLNHTFGLEHHHPKTGEIVRESALKGIPQGPDLSAYLANISLFDLDAMMLREVAQFDAAAPRDGACAAAYARYVDDIVLICPDVETASQLRRKIEAHLAILGLSLNRKNATPPPMTREQARAWITDNRAGFGFSGPLADLPTTDSMDPLAEAGDIDRKTALGMIYDPALDNPENTERALERITRALQAPNLRFNDRAGAYRRLWIFAAHDHPPSTPALLARAFLDLACRVDPALATHDGARRDAITACLEGLDRALRMTAPPGTLSEAAHENLDSRVKSLAAAVLNDVFAPLVRALTHGDEADDLLRRYDVRTQISVMALSAAQILGANSNDVNLTHLRRYIDGTSGDQPLYSGLQWSLRRFDRRVIGPRPLSVTRPNAAEVVFTRIHGAIVQLQRLARHGGEEEELLPLSHDEMSDPNHLVQVAGQILKLWSRSAGEEAPRSAPTQLDLDAAATLVNLTHRRFAEIAARRPDLLNLIAGQQHARALPSPPGLQSQGIMLWCDTGRLLLARPSGEDADPVGVTWTPVVSPLASTIVLKEANLPLGCKPLYVEPRGWTPRDIAKAYRAFFPIWHESQQQAEEAQIDIPIPTVFSFFAQIMPNGDLEALRMVSWTAATTTVDGHAFVRTGDALEARSVFADGAEFWRYGWSIRDLCGRVELSNDEDSSSDLHAAVSLERETHRREAIVTRVLPRLSGADRWGPGSAHPESAIPTRIERGLRLLEHFGSKSVSVDATYLVAATSEGAFMNERVNGPDELSVPGAPARLLLRAAKRAMRALPPVAAHWAAGNSEPAIYRRTTVAWFAAAERLREQISEVEDGAEAALRTLGLGAELLGVTADLRALAFEIAGGLDAGALERLASARLAQDWLGDVAGLELLLVEGGPTADLTTTTQMRRLITLFCEIVLAQRSGLRGLRDQILPAGWAVLVAALLQVIPVEDDSVTQRPALWPMDATRLSSARTALTSLLKAVTIASAAQGDSAIWPWDAFTELQDQWPENTLDLLRDLTAASAITITTRHTWINPRSDESPPGHQIVRLPDGSSISLADWQVDIAHIQGEKGTTTETRDVGRRLEYVYSLAQSADLLLGLHLVSRQLAATAFGIPVATSRIADEPSGRTSMFGSEQIPPPAAGSSMQAVRELSSDQSPSLEKQPPAAANGVDTSLLEKVRATQRNSWKARAEQKGHGRHRVALLQWDVVDTYTAPNGRAGQLEGLLGPKGEPAAPDETAKGGHFTSTSEHRRRTILKAALATCADFGVDGLVLPEYSLRPETVNWLARHLRQTAAPIVVWCGTFRIPGGTQLDYDYGPSSTHPYLSAGSGPVPTGRTRFGDHTALLTCLRTVASGRRGQQVQFAARPKRYPSVAASELIRPPINEPWHPLLQATNPFELASFTIELICSEMFPHASSANFVGLIDENEALAQRYGLPPNTLPPFEYLAHDVYEFAKWTSYRNASKIRGDTAKHLWRGANLQRTLIILPAMTSRSADYHIFGQNQYLAAGLVTVFCNAVEAHYGCGESCFIGLDGWRETESPSSPYGTVAPGVFQIGSKHHSGPLGRREAAMVIADLDLIRTADQKPRPHYQDRALELVAHLPLIFHTEASPEGQGDDPHRQRRVRRRNIPSHSSAISFDIAVAGIKEALLKEKDWRAEVGVLHAEKTLSAAYEAAVAAADVGLETIEKFAEHSLWALKRRRAFHSHRHETPYLTPCPALVDWIYVDDRWLPASRSHVETATADALATDQPRLTVPKLQAEASRKPS